MWPLHTFDRGDRGKYDSKSPLRQFVTRIDCLTQAGGGTRKWKCNICGTKWFGGITSVNAHFLFWTRKGVRACQFLRCSKNLHYRIEFSKHWGIPDDLGIEMPTTLSSRQQIQSIQQSHEQQLQGKPHVFTPRS